MTSHRPAAAGAPYDGGMDPVSSTALSGLQAAQTRLSAAGHNIANAATPGFRRQTVDSSARPAGGVTTTLRTADVPGEDLASDVVGLVEAKHAFGANLQVFRAQDAMMGSLLDATS